MSFALHPTLEKETYYLGDFPLCALLLSKDANYPWFILVPRQANIEETFQLNHLNQQQLQFESSQLSKALHHGFQADKMNIAALGNVVPQLHVHHIVRYKTDNAWPKPIWGHTNAIHYEESQVQALRIKINQLLSNTDFKPHNS